MGDKSPKSRQREKNQKDAVKTQSKNDAAKRAATATPVKANAGKK